MKKEIIIGNGNILCYVIYSKKKKMHGLVMRKHKEKHIIGEYVQKEMIKPPIKDNDFIVWFKNLNGTKIVHDCLHKILEESLI